MVTPAPADMVGRAFTDTIFVAVFTQPLASVPVTVYVLVTVVVVTTVAPVVANKAVFGAHV